MEEAALKECTPWNNDPKHVQLRFRAVMEQLEYAKASYEHVSKQHILRMLLSNLHTFSNGFSDYSGDVDQFP